MVRQSEWLPHFRVSLPSTSWRPTESSISLTVHGTLWAYRRRYMSPALFIRVASNQANPCTCRWVSRDLSPRTGSFIALFLPQSGGTISCSLETACSSSGRKNRFDNGARHAGLQFNRSSGSTNSGRSRQRGIQRDCKRSPGGLSQMKCERFLPGWAWKATSGTQDRIASDNSYSREEFKDWLDRIDQGGSVTG